MGGGAGAAVGAVARKAAPVDVGFGHEEDEDGDSTQIGFALRHVF